MGRGRAGRHHFQRRVSDTADGPTVARPRGIRRVSSCAPAAIVAAMLKGAEERARELCAMQANLSGNDKDTLDAYERDFIGRFPTARAPSRAAPSRPSRPSSSSRVGTRSRSVPLGGEQ